MIGFVVGLVSSFFKNIIAYSESFRRTSANKRCNDYIGQQGERLFMYSAGYSRQNTQ